MNTLQEGDLEFSFAGSQCARKFDGPAHKLSHCLKAVDFVVEFPDKYLFVELKDPENPDATTQRTADWINEFASGSLDNDLISKFRDSLIYEWAAGRADKPIFYYVLVAITGRHIGLLAPKTSDLKRRLPSGLPPQAVWRKPIALDCQIFNIQSWNSSFPDFPVRRISSGRVP